MRLRGYTYYDVEILGIWLHNIGFSRRLQVRETGLYKGKDRGRMGYRMKVFYGVLWIVMDCDSDVLLYMYV